jgi:hypothetical protein
MKTTLLLLLAAALPLSAQTPVRAPAQPKMSEVYQQGVSAFHRGDYVTAKAAFLKVQQANPQHAPTKSYLTQIFQAERGAALAAKSPEARLSRLIAPEVNFEQAKLDEVLEWIRLKAQNLAPKGQAPNFVFRLGASQQNVTVTLRLTSVSLRDVLRTVADVGQLEIDYQPYAIIVKPLGS